MTNAIAIKWSRTNEQGYIEAHNLPGVYIERVDVFAAYPKRIEYWVTADSDNVARFPTLGAAKGFVQAIVNAAGSAD